VIWVSGTATHLASGDRAGPRRHRRGLAVRRAPAARGRLHCRAGRLIFIQIGANLANDYSDARRGADSVDRLGPVRVTSAGLVTPQRVLRATWIAFAVAVACGIYLAIVAGWIILVVGVASIAAGVLYTGGRGPTATRGSARYSSSSSSAWSPSTGATTCSWKNSTRCRSGSP